ncbi:MAG: extracellular solute-binding protein [Specibacter sp.]
MQRSKSRWMLGAGIITAGALLLTGCGGSGFDNGSKAQATGSQKLTVMIGSSGDAETAAVKEAAAGWSSSSGTASTVIAAADLNQQLSQGFASGKPADVFYVSTDALAGFAANGSLYAYGDKLANKKDFYPGLVDSFTYGGKFYCAPKDFSTLGLVINTEMWKAAGLTDADIPTTWDQLTTVAKKLTRDGHVGLALSPEYARVGAFMVQAGGTLLNADQTKATVDTPENLAGLDYVKSLLKDGSAKFTTQLGAGWGGEAFGKGKAAMTVEGNWIAGAMTADYPKVGYKVVQLPAGPKGAGTLQFSNCWGIAADSPNKDEAVKLVEKLTSTEQQLAFAKAFGVMPSVQSAADAWKSANPTMTAFLAGADGAKNMPSIKGSADVVADLNSQLESLSATDPAKILAATQKNMEAVASAK